MEREGVRRWREPSVLHPLVEDPGSECKEVCIQEVARWTCVCTFHPMHKDNS